MIDTNPSFDCSSFAFFLPHFSTVHFPFNLHKRLPFLKQKKAIYFGRIYHDHIITRRNTNRCQRRREIASDIWPIQKQKVTQKKTVPRTRRENKKQFICIRIIRLVIRTPNAHTLLHTTNPTECDLIFNSRPFATITRKTLTHYIKLLSTLSGELNLCFLKLVRKPNIVYWLE